MKKKIPGILSLLLCLVLFVSLVSCGEEKHEAKAGWKYDETGHWHECATEGHDDKLDVSGHNFGAGVITVDPTETADGVKTFTCADCDYRKTEPVPALGHTHTFAEAWTTSAEKHWHASTCGHDVKKDEGDHHFDAGVITTDPTETADGVKTFTCADCGYQKTESVPALGHTHTFAEAWTTSEEKHWHASSCGHDVKKDEGDHIFTAWTVETPAGYGTSGTETSVCDTCGYIGRRTTSPLAPKSNTVTTDATLRKTYDGAGIPLGVDDIRRNGDGAVTFVYKRKGTDAEFSTVAPKDAGEYLVRINVAATAEWEACTTAVTYTIEAKELIFDLSDLEKNYDGTSRYTYVFSVSDGLITGDKCTYTFDVGTRNATGFDADCINAGSYTYVVSKNEECSNPNYTVRDQSGLDEGQGTSLTILKKDLSGLTFTVNFTELEGETGEQTVIRQIEGTNGKVSVRITFNRQSIITEKCLTLRITDPERPDEAKIELVADEDGAHLNCEFDVDDIGILELEDDRPELEATYTQKHADSVRNKAYNGAAVFVGRNEILINGIPLDEITDVMVLGRISYRWRNRNTKADVICDKDITIDGTTYTFGADDRTVGNEFAGPCVAGEYEFVLFIDGKETLTVDATITESRFAKIDSTEDFSTSTAPTIFGELNYYAIVAVVDGRLYVMQMPADASSVLDATNVEAAARLVTAGEDGALLLGGEFDLVFTNFRYFLNEWKYYPEDSTAKEDLLLNFGTGYYGSVQERRPDGPLEYYIYRKGYTSLSGDKIARYKEDESALTYGYLTHFAADGAVTIYAPRKGETENNALRLVKDGDRYVFTGRDKTTDTRESYPVYIYKFSVPEETSESYEFTGDLDKTYDGEDVCFSVYKDLSIRTESGEDIGSLMKMGMCRFVFVDEEGNRIAARTEDDMIYGPSAVGTYRLLLEIEEKGEDGPVWVAKIDYLFSITASE